MVVDCPLPGAAEARLPVDFPGGFGRGSQDLPMRLNALLGRRVGPCGGCDDLGLTRL